MTGSEQTLFTVREAALLLRVSESTIRNAIRTGRLAAYRFGNRGGTIRISEVALRRYLDESCALIARSQQDKSPSGPMPFKYLDGSKLLAAWRQQGVQLDPPGECSAQSFGRTCVP
jgi:excisionase family DNA binding protein